MGLDMYLTKRNRVKNWNFTKEENLHKITVERGGKLRKDIKPDRIAEIIEEVMYWRKANAIHRWFVTNVQEGADDCKEYPVEIQELKFLLDLCQKVLDKPELAKQLLPTEDGFFFGDTEYDQYYFDDLKATIKELKPVIKEAEREIKKNSYSVYFYYRSSW